MDVHPTGPNQREYQARVLDQEYQFLADATVLLTPEDQQGSFYPHAGVSLERIKSDARFLELNKENVIPLVKFHYCGAIGVAPHFHFS